MNRLHHVLTLLVLATILHGCVVFAPPSPLVTYGGPQTTPEQQSEVALGIGSGAARFEDAHAGGLGYMLRYKYGISQKFDVGIDAIGVVRSDKGAFTGKAVGRYQVADHWRLEGGIGLADDSDGKSINGDAAITWGTLPKTSPWNFYSSFRIGGAKGYPGDLKNGTDEDAPPDTWISLLNIGTQGKLSENQRFIFEGGYGYVFPQGENAGTLVYVSGGLLFYIGREMK
jgi:hypothetical protein